MQVVLNLTSTALVHSRHPPVYRTLLNQDLGPNALPPHLHHPCIPACYKDYRSDHGAVVDRYHTRRLLDLHPHRIQLEPDNLCPLRQQTATRHYTANTLDCHGSRNSAYASANGMESALATATEGRVG